MNALTRPAGKLFAVTGIDGAGKTTLAASLHAALGHSGHDAILVGKHTTEIPMSADLSEYAGNLNAVIYRRKSERKHRLRRLLLAVRPSRLVQPAGPAHHPARPPRRNPRDPRQQPPQDPRPVRDQPGAHRTRPPGVRAPHPDITLLLQIPAERALHRKQAFTSLETGHTGSTAEAFTAYQDSVAAELRHLAAGGAWVTIDVACKHPDIVLNRPSPR